METVPAVTKSSSPAKVPLIADGKTRVLGYYNPNPWPVHVNLSQFGLQMQLPGHVKGKTPFILDKDTGKRINDPALEICVGKNMLEREIGAEFVEINPIPKSEPFRTPTQHTVSEATGMKESKAGVVPTFSKAKPSLSAPPIQSTSPVGAMSREQAEKLGFIKKTRVVRESTIEDTDGSPIQGDRIPEIDYAVDVRTPGEARRAATKVIAPPDSENNPLVAKMMGAVPAAEPELDLVKAAKAALPGATPLPQPNLPESVDVVTAPVVTSVPMPAMSPVTPVISPVTPVVSRAKFVCSVDGKDFAYRSELNRWAKRKYPDRVEEIMAPYPKS